ncbi:hypothetical protein Sango_2153100 [Sesamum angolense]|uniref:DUF241 domain protein n=1 Tax=Sesamum angolense TaxID=2727404 RepID=A0AAE1WCM7_9LAMI|nr:hypothetical protein Sango_2153100 [Sesamum angolense]
MAAFHSRSNSFPSQSHPVMDVVEDHLCRLKSSESASTSTTSICANLVSVRDLHEGLNNLIQMPSVQQALSNVQDDKWINELLDGSLRLVDLCGFSRDIVCLTKESVQVLESSIRRNKALPDKDYDLKAIGKMLKETEALAFSIIKSVLILVAGEKERSKQRSWSLLSKFTQTSRVHSEVQQEAGAENFCSFNIFKSLKSMDNIVLRNTLKESEMTIEKLEEGLEALFRSLVKTRVSLLNVLSH